MKVLLTGLGYSLYRDPMFTRPLEPRMRPVVPKTSPAFVGAVAVQKNTRDLMAYSAAEETDGRRELPSLPARKDA